jgi:hypothetical protein
MFHLRRHSPFSRISKIANPNAQRICENRDSVELDHWLKTRALANQQKGFTAVLVLHEANRVIAYYGFAPTAVVPNLPPRSIRTGQPPDPVPCLLLGQLATDIAWAGRGIGTGLAKHALERCVQAAALVGGRALVVNAVDADAAAFVGVD